MRPRPDMPTETIAREHLARNPAGGRLAEPAAKRESRPDFTIRPYGRCGPIDPSRASRGYMNR